MACLEAESRIAIKFVLEGVSTNHPFSAIVSQNKNLIHRDWQLMISHVFKEGNHIIDFLACFAHSLSLGLHVLERPRLDVGVYSYTIYLAIPR